MNYGLKKGGGDQVLVLQKRINYKENFKLLLLIIVQTVSLRCVLIQHIIFGFCAYIHTYHRNYQLTSFTCHGLSNCEASVIHRYGQFLCGSKTCLVDVYETPLSNIAPIPSRLRARLYFFICQGPKQLSSLAVIETFIIGPVGAYKPVCIYDICGTRTPSIRIISTINFWTYLEEYTAMKCAMNLLPLSSTFIPRNTSFVTSSKVMTSSAVGLVPILYLQIELLCMKIRLRPMIFNADHSLVSFNFCLNISFYILFLHLVSLFYFFPRITHDC